MTASGGPAVELVRVSRHFEGLPAVSHVTLDVAVGEVILLSGANGSGKSTLLGLIATLLSPTYGTGAVLGCDLVRDRQRVRARVEFLGHRARFYDELTALENLQFTCALYGVPADRLRPALEAVGLHEVADSRLGHFSQGMRQRLALARARLRRPEVLLLDEPYAGLDVEARVVVDDLVRDARAGGRTVLLASHEAPDPALVDRTFTLAEGRVLTGPPAPAGLS